MAEEKEIEVTETDSPVLDKYKTAYYSQKLTEAGVSEDELISALGFVADKLEDDGSNEDNVIFDLKVNMRLEERQRYVDPSPGNRSKAKATPVSGHDIGTKSYRRIKSKLRGGWLT